jgi:NADH-quinone oxidoreductase subunit A
VSDFLRSYLTVVVFAVAAAVLVGGILGLSRLIQPRHLTSEKLISYESGVDPLGGGWSQSQVRYYIFALLFVMFDVEAIFIFPWAVQLDALATFGLVEMIVFVVILALGLVYAWRKGVLRWV